MYKKISDFLNWLWYEKNYAYILFIPLSLIYYLVSLIRSIYLKLTQKKQSLPIIVVGNITSGGVGKTPLVIELTNAMKKKGLNVGIVSRGYQSKCDSFPYEVKSSDTAWFVGDEPLLISQKTNCPVVISPKRTDAVKYLAKHHHIDVVISDDGLQHYAMSREMEIAVIDGSRGLGNGFCLPAGPLRELPSRLLKVDFCLVNGLDTKIKLKKPFYTFGYIPQTVVYSELQEDAIEITSLLQPIRAVAGLGNPQPFFNALSQLTNIEARAYSDHYFYSPNDFVDTQGSYVMTEKDAIKCKSFWHSNMFIYEAQISLPDAFWQSFWAHPLMQYLCKNKRNSPL